jgi:multidrug efflux pump subunit AcrB
MGVRASLVVATAIPVTLALTLAIYYLMGYTLNRVTLFALIFSIGILVDDAIVVVENIHRHLAMDVSAKGHVAKGDVSRSQNLSEGMAHGHVAKGDVSRSQNTTGSATPDSDAHEPLRQRLARIIPVAVDEVGGPTILATFTVIAALLPMAFVSGLMGPYMSPIPINSSLGMALSLLIAFSLTPWLALRLMKDHIASSCSIARDDFDYAELAARGGLQKAWGLFGEELDGLMAGMNEELVA